MTNKFDETINRLNTDSMKWDVKKDQLAMWVADMDFKCAPEIIEALSNRVNHGLFGYSVVTDDYFQSIQDWWVRRHHVHYEKSWMIFTTGVVAAITTAVQRLTNIGDNVLIQTPTFNVFYNSILNHGRHVLENQLIYDGHSYSIDFDDLELKLSNPQTKLMILCNPQNPSGTIWTKLDLEKIGTLAQKYNVIVLSDEIHCDLCDPGFEYIPYASVSETCLNHSVTCVSASKAFNLAGLQSAAVIIANLYLREIMERGLNSNEVAEPNVFAPLATIAAFNKSEKWLEDVRVYIKENKEIVYTFIEENCPLLSVVKSQATYLVWIDISRLLVSSTKLTQFIMDQSGLIVSDGTHYGGNGSQFIRLNSACSKERLRDGLERLKLSYDALNKG